MLTLTLLFVYPTYLLGVPSLGRQESPSLRDNCTRSDSNSAPKLMGYYVCFCSPSLTPGVLHRHNMSCALCIYWLQRVVQRLRLKAGPTKAFRGWKGWSYLLSPKIKIFNTALQMSASAGFHTDLQFQNWCSLLNPGFVQKTVPSDSPRGKLWRKKMAKVFLWWRWMWRGSGQGVNPAQWRHSLLLAMDFVYFWQMSVWGFFSLLAIGHVLSSPIKIQVNATGSTEKTRLSE